MRNLYFPTKVCYWSSSGDRKISFVNQHSLPWIRITNLESYLSVVNWKMYTELVRKLIYLYHARTSIAYLDSVVSQFMHDLKEVHLWVIYWILHYLKGSLGKEILFKRNFGLAMEAYMNADYAGSLVVRRFTSGYCAFSDSILVLEWEVHEFESLLLRLFVDYCARVGHFRKNYNWPTLGCVIPLYQLKFSKCCNLIRFNIIKISLWPTCEGVC